MGLRNRPYGRGKVLGKPVGELKEGLSLLKEVEKELGSIDTAFDEISAPYPTCNQLTETMTHVEEVLADLKERLVNAIDSLEVGKKAVSSVEEE